MEAFTDIASVLVLAATEGGEEEGGSFLVSPSVGLMIWTLIAFGATFLILRKLAFPRIEEALDKRRRTRSPSRSTRPSTPRRRPTSCSRSTARG